MSIYSKLRAKRLVVLFLYFVLMYMTAAAVIFMVSKRPGEIFNSEFEYLQWGLCCLSMIFIYLFTNFIEETSISKYEFEKLLDEEDIDKGLSVSVKSLRLNDLLELVEKDKKIK